MFKSYTTFFLFINLIALISCSDRIVDSCEIEDSGFDNRYAEIQSEIFNKSCVGCHGGGAPSGDLNLESGQSYQNLVNVLNSSSTATLVVPDKPGESYLLLRMVSSQGDVMPPAGNVSENLLELVEKWIENGAQDN